MRDVLDHLRPWYRDGERFAVATVIDTFRSAPRLPGAAMAVSAAGEAVGSVSGGCVEGAVYELAREVIETGRPAVARYGVADDDAFAVGLTCGGIIDILVQPVDAATFTEFDEVAASIDTNPVAIATVVSPGTTLGERIIVWPDRVSGGLGDATLDAAVIEDAVAMLEQGTTAVRHYGPRGERMRDEIAVFVQSFAPPARMVVFGAIDFAAAVARIGKFLGYHVTVCDARPVFATRKRFPDADEVVVDWPHRYLAAAIDQNLIDGRTALCVLTHDPKFDVPLLELALRTEAGFIGAMGSRRTHDDRLAQLRELGLTKAELSRLASPIGLDLGARTPEETAVSIAAEIIAARWGATGRPLSNTTGRIHGESVDHLQSVQPE
ncbi:xanthine dehydrogenase accessory factor [Actinokineospora alba]|uniref:Xanthine dehydrogenase accessory factor n=1 Tax=Actinokineospora alba TaxID=504798 RepID=A0A1H0G295_9PSEU|nr:XdhC/CoxI family protein [Actinokineospora alba]TDP69729.1 xanthine dehydrogenase accessory factor [Actinokineospora alba]SDI10013.1 xanthine dehydrogenase accessory factor [Actinokineospora alba]SDO01006.1 xanthine dehydrogenase accessory factor [Actinokineospora alba]